MNSDWIVIGCSGLLHVFYFIRTQLYLWIMSPDFHFPYHNITLDYMPWTKSWKCKRHSLCFMFNVSLLLHHLSVFDCGLCCANKGQRSLLYGKCRIFTHLTSSYIKVLSVCWIYGKSQRTEFSLYKSTLIASIDLWNPLSKRRMWGLCEIWALLEVDPRQDIKTGLMTIFGFYRQWHQLFLDWLVCQSVPEFNMYIMLHIYSV